MGQALSPNAKHFGIPGDARSPHSALCPLSEQESRAQLGLSIHKLLSHNEDRVPLAAIFVFASAALALFSKRSLASPRSHGFYRFFAFECILALILSNLRGWFRDMLSIRQCAATLLLTASVVLAVVGFRSLQRIGKPDRNAPPGSNLRFENTTTLVTVGIYRFIRHPMYASLLALGWGVFLKRPSVTGLVLALAASAFLSATALREERENVASFGDAYLAYMRTTRRFVPYLL